MTVNNQKPQYLLPAYKPLAAGQFDPIPYIKSTLAEPLYAQNLASHPVEIKERQRDVTPDDIVAEVINCCGDVQNPNSEAWCKELYSQTLINFDRNTTLNIKSLFAIQSGIAANLPSPSVQVVYTPASDIIPASKHYLAGKIGYDELFATFAFYARPETLGFFFVNNRAFDDFKDWFKQRTTPMMASYPAETNSLLQQFDKDVALNDLTESLKLRDDDSQNNDENSFPRVLMEALMEYGTQVSPSEFCIAPFDLGELFCPKSIVFINVENHAHSSAKKISDEWNVINLSTNMKIQMISNGKLSKLTAAARNLKHIASQAANALSNKGTITARSMNIKFRHTAPNVVDVTRYILKVLGKMAQVSRSENSYKSVKMTFSKPNRRNPDDYNKQGKSVSTKYRPDIHIYIDTSGSISEENYQSAVQACIKLAKKLNINVYFNSFSHILSQCTKLNTKDKTPAQIYKQFQKVPKVAGGTDYEQIWRYINKNPKRRRELSLIITDFEYNAPNRFTPHPKNLYYLPCSHCSWAMIQRSATDFCHSMKHIDPNARSHILF